MLIKMIFNSPFKVKHFLAVNAIIVFSIKEGKVNYPPKNSFPKINILS